MTEENFYSGLTVVVGVTGGIAAFRAVDLVSNLGKRGADVHVVMTRAAREFVGPVTFEAISGNSVHLDMFDVPPGWRFPHLELARKADAVIVAPATAHFLARAAGGMADDLLSTMLLACEGSVFVCPAMNVRMYRHPAVQDNLARLREYGYKIVEPSSGRLACGDTGPGRLAATEQILQELESRVVGEQDLQNCRILVTAGATREAIDPVRFISNRSSGKMGFALAGAASKRGARVVLVSGPLHPEPPCGVELVEVESAVDMQREILRRFASMDIVIKAAAVGDYAPKHVSTQKIKKDDGRLWLELERNPDILMELGRRKERQILVGFAAETEDVKENAAAKLKRKNLDLMVANDVTVPGAGFGTDTNMVKLIFRGGIIKDLPMMEKIELAGVILDEVKEIRAGREK